MVDERDEQYDDEEGEYHFSDDQISYDVESDAEKTKTAATGSTGASLKDLVLSKLMQNRRAVIGSVVFFLLIGVIYKIVMPSSSAPSTDFAASTTAAEPVVTAQAPVKRVEAPVTQPAPPVTQPATMQAEQQPESVSPAAIAAAATQQPAESAMTPPVANTPGAPVQEANQQTLSPMQQAQVATMPQTATIPPPFQGQNMPAAPVAEAPSKNTNDRLASVEQQNAAIMNLLQTEYAQKISDYETQNMSSRGKMEEMTKRLNRMEATLTQITQLLQNGNRSANSGMTSSPQGMIVGVPPAELAKVSSGPKMVYAVQAIIPGRAWLKSDAGDTVTVAEGDVLRSYGRVTKIDPYDGIVNIDTGNKVITLSYGLNAE